VKESFNDDFLERYFHNTDGNLMASPEMRMLPNRSSGSRKRELTHADLKVLARAAREPNAAGWEQLQKVLDVDRFLSIMAMEVMLCHWDGYTFGTHNYRVYHDLDTDKSFSSARHGSDDGRPHSAIMPDPAGLVAQAVLHGGGPETLSRAFGPLYTNVFQPGVITRASIRRWIPGAFIKTFDPRLAAIFTQNAAGLRTGFSLEPPRWTNS
jgi:hypothetical protein